VCALRKKNERDAIDYFERALRLAPDNMQALLSLADIQYRRGQLEVARDLVGRFNKLSEPTAESLWLALRTERKLGDKAAESAYAAQLRRRFSGSKEYQDLLKGQF
jgi:type IV pilus assembly protein PilF